MIVVKRLKILTWLGVALVLAIVVSGVSVAEYHAEVLYDYRFKFILEMILMPLLLFLLSMVSACFVKKAKSRFHYRKTKIDLVIVGLWIAATIGAIAIAYSIDGTYSVLSRLVLPLVSVLAGIAVATMRDDEG